jgi:hypothetical protein
MEYWSRTFAGILSSVFFVIALASVAISQDQAPKADYTWLNGEWEGMPPSGGQLRMALQVTNGNQVKGSGRIVQGGNRNPPSREIEGTVNGDKVELTWFGNETVKYLFTYVDGALTGTGTLSGETPVETTFKKLKQ